MFDKGFSYLVYIDFIVFYLSKSTFVAPNCYGFSKRFPKMHLFTTQLAPSNFSSINVIKYAGKEQPRGKSVFGSQIFVTVHFFFFYF